MSDRRDPVMLWVLDVLVCCASAGIGFLWGQIYGGRGELVGSAGGLMVAVVWCWAMRRILGKNWNSFVVCILAACLGSLAGLIDGAALHMLCWDGGDDMVIPHNLFDAVNIGIIFGFFSGLANGAFWGLLYVTVSKMEINERGDHV